MISTWRNVPPKMEFFEAAYSQLVRDGSEPYEIIVRLASPWYYALRAGLLTGGRMLLQGEWYQKAKISVHIRDVRDLTLVGAKKSIQFEYDQEHRS